MSTWTPEDLADMIDNEGLGYMIDGYLGPITADMLVDFPDDFNIDEFVRHWNMANEGLRYVDDAIGPYMS